MRLLHSSGSGPVSALPGSTTSTSRVRRPQLAGSDPLTIAALPLTSTDVTTTSDPSTLSLSSGRLPVEVSVTAERSTATTLTRKHVTPGQVQ
ncbi:hypothetical protein NESM_000776700 [Novymonas esmeraldas]|uniref:Uncharacterized protein n=1 Tax=Novymonas esmeraldas TaxID=1808958 RepID=A0AAW0EY46_9TRYP